MSIAIRKLTPLEIAETVWAYDPELDQHADAEAAKEEAIARVERNADPTWLMWAKLAVSEVARKQMFFTTDDVWDALEKPFVNEAHEPRAMGTVMRSSIRGGVCFMTGTYQKSRRKVNHQRPIPVYASAVYNPAG